MSPPPPFRCAEAARSRSDSQLGSAPQTRRWLLIEHRGPWQLDALAGSGIAPEVLAALTDTARAQGARPLLIRRPGRSPKGALRSWAVIFEDGASLWGSWRTDDDLLGAVDALSSPSPLGSVGSEPVILACTHGLHDVCCALRGRPVAAALRLEWPAATWECSHVGGDRFAANIVILPDGVYYGLLDPDSAVETVRAHLRGELSVANLRGMTSAPPPAQVAIAAVHERLGPLGPRDVAVRSVDHGSPGVWDIELSAPVTSPGLIRVRVSSSRQAPAKLTCRAGAETPATQYHVVDFVTDRE